MNIHLAFLLNTVVLALAFVGGRRWSRMTVLPYRQANMSISRQHSDLFRYNQAGRIIQFGSAAIWIVITAVYLALCLKFLSE